jgi:hypothetical protein
LDVLPVSFFDQFDYLHFDRGRDEGKLRPSLRTGQADFLHPALQLVVTFEKIDMPQRVLVLRYTSPLW